MKKRFLALTLALAMTSALLAGCGGSSAPAASAGSASGSGSAAPTEPAAELTATQKIIAEAEGMTLEELAKKAIEESNGATFYGVGNSSRGKTALPLFIEYLQSIDPSYNMEYDWQQPKNNKIFDQLTADALKPTGTYRHDPDPGRQPDREQDGPARRAGYLHPQGLGRRQRHHRRRVHRLPAPADPEQGLYVQQHRLQDL